MSNLTKEKAVRLITGETNHKHSEIPLLTIWMASIRKERKGGREKVTGVSKDMKKLEPSCIADRDVKWCSCSEKQCSSSSKN